MYKFFTPPQNQLPQISCVVQEWGGSRWVLAPPGVEEDTGTKAQDAYSCPCLSLVRSLKSSYIHSTYIYRLLGMAAVTE